MDLQFYRDLAQPFIELTVTILVSGVGVSAVTQALKDFRVPIPVERFPRSSAAILSVLATIISLYVSDVNLLLIGWVQYVGLALSILVASAFSYNILFKGINSKNIDTE